MSEKEWVTANRKVEFKKYSGLQVYRFFPLLLIKPSINKKYVHKIPCFSSNNCFCGFSGRGEQIFRRKQMMNMELNWVKNVKLEFFSVKI